MSRPEVVAWFDAHWYPAFSQADGLGWDALPRRDRVLALAGAVIDAFVGSDRYTLYRQAAGRHADEMAGAFEAVGLPEEAAALRAINAAFPGGRPAADDAERERQVDGLPGEAWAPWRALRASFDRWVPGGERVMLTRLYEWYHSQAE
jgi:hypothetical protein